MFSSKAIQYTLATWGFIVSQWRYHAEQALCRDNGTGILYIYTSIIHYICTNTLYWYTVYSLYWNSYTLISIKRYTHWVIMENRTYAERANEKAGAGSAWSAQNVCSRPTLINNIVWVAAPGPHAVVLTKWDLLSGSS